MKIIINKPTQLILGIRNQALIFSTNNLPGFDQMALDLNSLEQTISNPEIILTLRFYYWTGDWLSPKGNSSSLEKFIIKWGN